MNALPFTVMAIAIIAGLTFARLHQAVDAHLLDGALQRTLQAHRDSENAYQTGLYTIQVHTNLKPGPKKGTKQKKRRNVAKITRPRPEKVAKLLAAKPLPVFPALLDMSLPLQGEETYQEIALALFQTLYGETDFYTDSLGREILERLAVKTQSVDTLREDEFQGTPTTATELASYDLEDDRLQLAWIKILQGRNGSYSSLLDYITYAARDNASKINVMYAPLPLLKATFQDESIVQSLIEKRQEIRIAFANKHEATDEKSFCKEREEELRLVTFEMLSRHEALKEKLAPVLDFSLSYKPPILMIEEDDESPCFTVRLRRAISEANSCS